MAHSATCPPGGVVVATEGGLVRFGPWDDVNNDASPQYLRDALDGSLRRLKLDHIELFRLHRIDPKVPVETTFGFLRQAQRDGQVRHVELSEVSVEEIRHAQTFFEVTSVQNRYSIDNRAAEAAGLLHRQQHRVHPQVPDCRRDSI